MDVYINYVSMLIILNYCLVIEVRTLWIPTYLFYFNIFFTTFKKWLRLKVFSSPDGIIIRTHKNIRCMILNHNISYAVLSH